MNYKKLAGQVKCKVCSASYTRAADLRTHLKIHGKHIQIGKKQFLERHTKIIHEKMKAYKCNSCDKSFGQKGHLNRHVKTVHEDIKLHESRVCYL